jgi:4-hydroxy-3-polyprenylbenzoate decarboxylase
MTFLTEASVDMAEDAALLELMVAAGFKKVFLGIETPVAESLKECRKLILVQRETPLSLPTIENMRAAKLAGATILPAMPAWYHGDQSVHGLIDFIVARILDQLGIEQALIRRWGEGHE